MTIKARYRIALISTPFLRTPPETYGGAERVVADLGSTLAKLGHDVTIFAADGSNVQGCHIVKFGPPALETGIPINFFETERRAYHVYKDMLQDFDIIHGHNWYGFHYLAKINNRKLKICQTLHVEIRFKHLGDDLRSFYRYGDYKPFLNDLLMRGLHARSNLNVIAISKFMTRVDKAIGYNSKWVHNGVDLDIYKYKQKKGDRLLFVGNIVPEKKSHLCIQVAKRLNMGLDIVGVIGKSIATNHSYVDKIKKMCDGKQIRLYDEESQKLNPKLKIELMQNAKCLIFPSMYGEPFGLVPLEAMACGTPAVVFNDGALEEFVHEGGIVCDVLKEEITPKIYHCCKVTVKSDLLNALTSAVKRVDSIPPIRCLENARRFSKERMAEHYIEMYDRILAGEKW